jgi:4a-hydroxytetrahydrobiopterin dehydratase
MDRRKLSDTEVAERLEEIPSWIFRNGKLYRELSFRDFSEAFGFMVSAAMVSERLDHHPDWSNVYNRVTITLWTHDVGGISEKDFHWAKKVAPYLVKA